MFLQYTGLGHFCQPSEISRLRLAYLHGNSRGRREALAHPEAVRPQPGPLGVRTTKPQGSQGRD